MRNKFDWVICDSPAGIERGATLAMRYADTAVIVTNPEVSSVRDSDRILGVLASKSRRAELNQEPVQEHLLLTRYDPERVERGDMLKVDDVLEILAIPLLGVVPESTAVLRASNIGMPVTLDEKSNANQAYTDAVARFLGETVEHRFMKPEKKGFLDRLLRRTARASSTSSGRLPANPSPRRPRNASKSCWRMSGPPGRAPITCRSSSANCWR